MRQGNWNKFDQEEEKSVLYINFEYMKQNCANMQRNENYRITPYESNRVNLFEKRIKAK